MNEGNRALLLNIGVFGANQNLRRNLSTISANYQAGNCAQMNLVQTLTGNETWTFKPSSNPTSLVVISVTNPVKAVITQGTVAGRMSQTYTAIINQVYIVDDSISEITFTNPSAVASTVSIVLG